VEAGRTAAAADPATETAPRATEVVTFGCRLNSFESEVIRGHAAAAGLDDTVIFNSCAVTAEAERQLRQAIRRTRRERPEATIIVTGCAAQIDPSRYAAMPEVDRVVGNREKLQAGTFARGAAPARLVVSDIMAATETAGHLVHGFAERTRAFVEVQHGCDHRCTFCIIPFGRGPSRSVPAADVVRQARVLVESGVREIVLTGVDLTAWGLDLTGEGALGDLAARLLRDLPDLPRLRLSSVDPVELDATLIRLVAEEPRLMPHLHLSVQAGSDLILKRMKRRHLRADVIELCARLRVLRPDIVFGADLIAGFPTETDVEFQRSLDLVEEAGLTWLHVFPYSERPGTPAARMPPVPRVVRKERAARLRTLGAAQVERHLASAVGTTAQVLMEKPGLGRTGHFAEVAVAGEPGILLQARITGHDGTGLTGVPI